MTNLKITARSQVTLRKDVLEHLGVAPGAKLVVDKLPAGRIEIRAAPSGEISNVFNLLKKKGGAKRPQIARKKASSNSTRSTV